MQTISDWIYVNWRRHARKEALIDASRRVTFGQAAERAWALARGLRIRGLEFQGTVGVLAKNSVFNAETFLGVAAADGVYGAYNWRWSAEELAEGIVESRATMIIVGDGLEQQLADAMKLVPGVIENRLAGAPTLPRLPIIITESEIDRYRIGTGRWMSNSTPNDLVALIYTGGSTGLSKAVELTHQAATTTFLNERLDLDLGGAPNEKGLIATPLFHVAGLFCWFVTHFASGKPVVLASEFSPESFVDLVEREQITNTFVIPNMLRQLIVADSLSNDAVRKTFRAMHTGAGLLQMPDKLAYFDALPDADLFYRYGLTEAGPMVTRLLTEDMRREDIDGSIGREYTFAQVELRDPEGDDGIVPLGELGEICVRSPSVMRGYRGRPAATQNALRNGWLRTGDLATMNDEGFVFFKDRLKDMVKTGGENVYCVEVEQTLYTHPAIQEVAVVGVPNDRWGEEVRAVVALRQGHTADEEELKTHVRQHLAAYKIPKQFVFMNVEDLPRSGAGKLVKPQLKMQLGWMS